MTIVQQWHKWDNNYDKAAKWDNNYYMTATSMDNMASMTNMKSMVSVDIMDSSGKHGAAST